MQELSWEAVAPSGRDVGSGPPQTWCQFPSPTDSQGTLCKSLELQNPSLPEPEGELRGGLQITGSWQSSLLWLVLGSPQGLTKLPPECP